MLKVLIAVLVALAAVFALQNMAPVALTFVAWQFKSPLAFVLLGAVGTGFAIATLTLMPTIVRGKLARSAGKRRISDLEQKLETTARPGNREKIATLNHEEGCPQIGDKS